MADAADLKSAGRKAVGVQVPLRAPDNESLTINHLRTLWSQSSDHHVGAVLLHCGDCHWQSDTHHDCELVLSSPPSSSSRARDQENRADSSAARNGRRKLGEAMIQIDSAIPWVGFGRSSGCACCRLRHSQGDVAEEDLWLRELRSPIGGESLPRCVFRMD